MALSWIYFFSLSHNNRSGSLSYLHSFCSLILLPPDLASCPCANRSGFVVYLMYGCTTESGVRGCLRRKISGRTHVVHISGSCTHCHHRITRAISQEPYGPTTVRALEGFCSAWLFISLRHAPLAWEIDRLKHKPATRAGPRGRQRIFHRQKQVADLARRTG